MKQGLFGAFVLSILFAGSAHASDADPIPAIILKVEGEGVANVRKKSGIVEVAGERGKVYVGDKIITDARSAVHLILTDGTVMKVGFNSEFALEEVQSKDRFLSWVFKLGRGAVRALVEKIPENETHLRIDTPSGTIGVRGTEFVLAHDGATAETELFLLDGHVTFGAPACEASKSCLEVKAGEAATLALGKAAIPRKQRLEMAALFAVPKAEGAPAAGGRGPEARLSLFRDAKRVPAKVTSGLDDDALKKLVADAQAELADAQDRAIGRTRAQRDAMYAAMKDGSYAAVIAAADSYAEAKGIFNAKSNAGAEDLVAQTAAAKFRLGQAVEEAEKAGVFADKPSVKAGAEEWKNREFRVRKNVEFDQSSEAKARREALGRAAEDYGATLEYAEALDADQVSEGDAKLAKGEEPEKTERKVERARDPGKCKDRACRSQRVAHEFDVASEGTVNAFHGHKAAAPRRGRTGRPGSVGTEFFTRVVPGDSCFKAQQSCHMQPCAGLGRGRKCKAGEVVQVCETKHVPVRCEGR